MALFRRIVEDYEARLVPPPAGTRALPGTGKAEHERFGDGEVQFEVRLRHLDVADNAELEVWLNGTVVARTVVMNARASLRLSSVKGDAIPIVQAGDHLEVRHRGTVLLEGSFKPD